MHLNRLLPLLTPLLTLILFEIFFFNPKMIYVVLVLVNLLIFFAVWQFSRASNANKDWSCFSGIIFPSLISTAVVVYTILLSNKFVIQLLFVLNIILLYFYLRYIYYYLVRPAAYKAFSIENISSYGNFLIFFLVATTIYGMQAFLSVKTWLLMIIMLAASGLIVYQVMWANKIDLGKGLIYILISCLIILELSWSISFLPLNHHIAGLITAICYYMLIGLVRHFLLDKLDKKIIRLYLGFGLTSLFIVLITARWL
ncbi:hypothetical protein KAU19_03605 [Candidatus Parcubacteria bacterium]|nr:hypothetical protein [Candidatus Parcubacteria bacterium]